MQSRLFRERLLQSVVYEVTGTLLATAAYLFVFGGDAWDALTLMVVLSAAFVAYAPFFNIMFDTVEWRLAQRVASDRPHKVRVLHAFLLEGSDIVLSVPILMVLGDHSLGEAIATDLGLLALHSAYAYFYYLAFDRLRPIPVTVSCDGLGVAKKDRDT